MNINCLYIALVCACLSQGAVAQSEGGFFSKLKGSLSSEVKIGTYTFKDGSVYNGEMKGRKPSGKGKTVFKSGDTTPGETNQIPPQGDGGYT